MDYTTMINDMLTYIVMIQLFSNLL